MRKLLLVVFFATLPLSATTPCPLPSNANTFIDFLGTQSLCTPASSTTCFVGEPIQFVVRTFGYSFACAPHRFAWTFGDGTATVHEPQVTHVYPIHGTFALTLTISTATHTVRHSQLITAGSCECFPFAAYRLQHSRTWRFLIVGAEGEGDWVWDFGDGTRVRTFRYQYDHEYTRGGQFLVRLSSMKGKEEYTTIVQVPPPKRRSSR